MTLGIRALLVGVASIALVGPMSASAQATPSTGVSAVILSQTTIGGYDYILREITIAPGGSTGWHFHDGTLYAYVRQGEITHYGSDCAVDQTGGAGTAFVERAGAGNVHVERNLGTEAQILDVLYVLPTGSPLSEDAPNPGCPFE
ncbi:cupin domain-containing protein [Nocardia yunnanensis]|uniref:Cupin domain-containing protein n=1 Tax=Nocardia yunnanensis TaxID=2382165 RepID=A0A386ZA41_9NOCA|nr:cupin domain-containing protein [Nocardia yunnanensis]AYF73984.1 cupin domain-containing protein [Nocardia yunnanensis]